MKRIRFGKRYNKKRKITHNDIIYLPENKLELQRDCLTIQEMELDCGLNNDEWNLLENINLSKREKQCLYMYYWEGITQNKIADDLNIERPVVSIYLKRARLKIAKYFNIDLTKMKTIRNSFIKRRNKNG